MSRALPNQAGPAAVAGELRSGSLHMPLVILTVVWNAQEARVANVPADALCPGRLAGVVP